ncbi:MAG TPA: pyridoxamine 5'-phosphate oxidase family protein [Candidatus Methylacidiphilales bacterium]|nr:pyridoxamine 5'-phosphate oxidase family protein [Candidatus Methylacidiphilales bacterium]
MDFRKTSDRLQKNEHHGEHVIRLAQQLADGNHPGVLATVGQEGNPHLRWMGTLSFQEFPHLYALTSPLSRKVGHIRVHPQVSWMFATDTSSMVINLSGKASILTDQGAINRIWRLIENKSNAYFLSLNMNADGVAVIDTVVEDIECIVPHYDLRYTHASK